MTETRESGDPGDQASAPELPLPEDVSARAQRLMEEHLEGIVGMLVQAAEEGDVKAAKIILDRVPAPGDRRIVFGLRRLESSKDATGAARDVLAAVAEGKITVREADRFLKLLQDFLKMSATQEFEARLAAVEAALPSAPNARQPRNLVERLQASERSVLPTGAFLYASEDSAKLLCAGNSHEFVRALDESVEAFKQRIHRVAREKYPGVPILDLDPEDEYL